MRPQGSLNVTFSPTNLFDFHLQRARTAARQLQAQRILCRTVQHKGACAANLKCGAFVLVKLQSKSKSKNQKNKKSINPQTTLRTGDCGEVFV